MCLMFAGATAFSLATGQISAIMTTNDELTEERKELMGKIHRLHRVQTKHNLDEKFSKKLQEEIIGGRIQDD